MCSGTSLAERWNLVHMESNVPWILQKSVWTCQNSGYEINSPTDPANYYYEIYCCWVVCLFLPHAIQSNLQEKKTHACKH